MWSYSKYPYRTHWVKCKCIFIHIPKVSGTSILSAIGKRGEKGRDHISWQVYKRSDKKKFDSYYKFAFVRNPYDRALSAYRYILSGGNQGKQDLAIAKEMAEYSDFDDFVARGLWRGAFRSHLLFLSQSSFVMDGNETLMVDFLGHFETLDKDFQQVANKLGISSEIAHRNKGSVEAGAGMTAATREKLAILYAQDFVNFGYTP